MGSAAAQWHLQNYERCPGGLAMHSRVQYGCQSLLGSWLMVDFDFSDAGDMRSAVTRLEAVTF